MNIVILFFILVIAAVLISALVKLVDVLTPKPGWSEQDFIQLLKGIGLVSLFGVVLVAVTWGPIAMLGTIANYLFTGNWKPMGNDWFIASRSMQDWLYMTDEHSSSAWFKHVMGWTHDKMPYPFAVLILGLIILAIVEIWLRARRVLRTR
jgi:hypothetical protein